MSAWSDWRVGALTDDEYRAEAAREERMDRAMAEYEEDIRDCEYCKHYKYNDEFKSKCCEAWDCEYEER